MATSSRTWGVLALAVALVALGGAVFALLRPAGPSDEATPSQAAPIPAAAPATEGKVIAAADRALPRPTATKPPDVASPKPASSAGDADVKMQISRFEAAIQQYYLDNRALPASLAELTQPSKKTGERYLDAEKVPDDPWGSAYSYVIVNASKREYALSSAGPDKIVGTSDDVDWTSADGFK